MTTMPYTVLAPLGLGTTVEFTFDVERVEVNVLVTNDVDGSVAAGPVLPVQARAFADAYLATWLFEPATFGYQRQAWVSKQMWQETCGERLRELSLEGLAFQGAARDAA